MKATRAESGTADQRRIDAYFTRESQFWKSLYKQTNLYGMIHQERRAGAGLDHRAGSAPGVTHPGGRLRGGAAGCRANRARVPRHGHRQQRSNG